VTSSLQLLFDQLIPSDMMLNEQGRRGGTESISRSQFVIVKRENTRPNPDHNGFTSDSFLIVLLQWQIKKAQYMHSMSRDVPYCKVQRTSIK
jgi:hypothetical protein